MTAVRRVSNILISLIEIMMGLLIILLPEFALPAVITLTGLSFIARGIQSLYFYFSLGRSMVGGRAALYRGLLYLDLGLFTCTFASAALSTSTRPEKRVTPVMYSTV